MSTNDKLLKAIRARGEKQEPFEFGILTADRWVLNIQDRIGLDNCYKWCVTGRNSMDDLLAKAARTLTYSNPKMKLESKITSTDGTVDGIQLPKNTLMVFRHTLTSSRVDRDGDILRSEGMEIDPEMLLLWQHVHTLPIGKSLKVANQDTNQVEMISAIVDMNELSHDAAVMIDNGMGRFSHGFRALEFEEMKSDDGYLVGFDVKRAEIMEESLVSVPANVDAETQEIILSLVDGGKLTSPLMKEFGESLKEKKNPVVSGITYEEKNGDYSRSVTCGNPEELKDVLRATRNNEGKDETNESKGADNEARTPEKADVKDDEGEEKGIELQEVKRRSGEVTGSWEETIDNLDRQAKVFLLDKITGMSRDDWVYIVATFEGSAVLCVEKPQYGVPDEFRYFKVEWTIENKQPVFSGDPSEVDLVTSAEMVERYADISRKKESQKNIEEAAIVVLSKSTEAQKRALVCQLKAMLPSQELRDYESLFS